MEPTEIQKIYDQKRRELVEYLIDSLSNILLGEKLPLDVVNAETGEIIIPANRKITKAMLRELAMIHDRVEIDPSPIRNKIREIVGSYEHKFAELELERERLIEQTALYQPVIELAKRAKNGDAQAQYDLGNLYYRGNALLWKDRQKAKALFHAAAKKQHVEAQISLGDCYAEEGEAEALEWYCKAAEQKSVNALTRLGDYHGNRWLEFRYRDWAAGVDSFIEAVRWYCKAIEQGDPDAHARYQLAKLCSAFRQPADTRYSFARLCSEYLKAAVGDWHDFDREQFRLAYHLYYSAANEGHPGVQTALGDCWAEGRKTSRRKYGIMLAQYLAEPEENDDVNKSDATYNEAGQPYNEHYFSNGFCDRCGRSRRTVVSLHLPCNWADSNAAENEEERKLMDEEDRAQAAKWYRKAAEQGDVEAQRNLAYCYAEGIGVARSEAQAAKWYRACGEYEGLGDLYARIGDKRRAAKSYRKAGLHWASYQIRDLGPRKTW